MAEASFAPGSRSQSRTGPTCSSRDKKWQQRPPWQRSGSTGPHEMAPRIQIGSFPRHFPATRQPALRCRSFDVTLQHASVAWAMGSRGEPPRQPDSKPKARPKAASTRGIETRRGDMEGMLTRAAASYKTRHRRSQPGSAWRGGPGHMPGLVSIFSAESPSSSLNSMRRLRARPSGVSLVSMGSSGPAPRVSIRLASIPWSMR